MRGFKDALPQAGSTKTHTKHKHTHTLTHTNTSTHTEPATEVSLRQRRVTSCAPRT